MMTWFVRSVTDNVKAESFGVGKYMMAREAHGKRPYKLSGEHCPFCGSQMFTRVNTPDLAIKRAAIECGPVVDDCQEFMCSPLPIGADVYKCQPCDVRFVSLAKVV